MKTSLVFTFGLYLLTLTLTPVCQAQDEEDNGGPPVLVPMKASELSTSRGYETARWILKVGREFDLPFYQLVPTQPTGGEADVRTFAEASGTEQASALWQLGGTAAKARKVLISKGYDYTHEEHLFMLDRTGWTDSEKNAVDDFLATQYFNTGGGETSLSFSMANTQLNVQNGEAKDGNAELTFEGQRNWLKALKIPHNFCWSLGTPVDPNNIASMVGGCTPEGFDPDWSTPEFNFGGESDVPWYHEEAVGPLFAFPHGLRSFPEPGMSQGIEPVILPEPRRRWGRWSRWGRWGR